MVPLGACCASMRIHSLFVYLIFPSSSILKTLLTACVFASIVETLFKACQKFRSAKDSQHDANHETAFRSTRSYPVLKAVAHFHSHTPFHLILSHPASPLTTNRRLRRPRRNYRPLMLGPPRSPRMAFAVRGAKIHLRSFGSRTSRWG